jgi:hypothetical protein
MKFAVSIVDPRSQTELPGIPYHVDILRGDSVLFSRDEVTTATISLDEYVFQDVGPAQVVVKDINNSASSVIFSINVVPEFPVLGATVALLGITFALAAARFAKTKSGSLT